MAITSEAGHFDTEADALTEIERSGLWSVRKAWEPEHNTPHWHAFDAHVYVLDGLLTVTDTGTGTAHACGAGARVQVPARTLHTESTEGATVLVGMSVDPASVEQPVQRPPSEL